jgi:hypothetical protein
MFSIFKKYITALINSRKLCPVPLTEEYDFVKFFYAGPSGKTDITLSQVLISLKELVIAIYIEGSDISLDFPSEIIIEKKNKRIGTLKLRYKDILLIDNTKVFLFDIKGFKNNERPIYTRITDYLLFSTKNMLNRIPNIFEIDAARLNRLFVYYLKPRPVFLISLKESDKVDMFPIDITGNIFGNYYLASVRTTNPSVKKMKETGKVCLSAIPYDARQSIYSLGKHHKNGIVDLDKIDFIITGSRLFNIPIPSFSICAIEAEVVNSFVMGLHTVFVLKTANNYQMNSAYQLAHTPWYNL